MLVMSRSERGVLVLIAGWAVAAKAMPPPARAASTATAMMTMRREGRLQECMSYHDLSSTLGHRNPAPRLTPPAVVGAASGPACADQGEVNMVKRSNHVHFSLIGARGRARPRRTTAEHLAVKTRRARRAGGRGTP